jgi:hypothetical protein
MKPLEAHLIPSYITSLAALRETDGRTRKRLDRDQAVYVKETYHDHARIVIPGPRRIARALVIPFLADADNDVFNLHGVLAIRRRGTDLLPQPVDITGALADRLCAALAELPDHSPRSTHYGNLRRLGRGFPEACREVVLAAIAVTYQCAPTFKQSHTRSSRAHTPAEHTAAHRERQRLAQDQSSAAFLDMYRAADDAPQIGERLVAPDLYESAVEWITTAEDDYRDAKEAAREYADDRYTYRSRETTRRRVGRLGGIQLPSLPEPREPESWEAIAADEGYPPRPSVPSRQRFYAVADSVLGKRSRSDSTHFYIVPDRAPTAQEEPMTIAEVHELADAYDRAADAGERLARVNRELNESIYASGTLSTNRDDVTASDLSRVTNIKAAPSYRAS